MNFLDSIREAEIRDLFLYWLRRRPKSGVPTRGDIDPARIPAAYLPDMFIYERQKNGRFLCRLIGTGLSRIFGRNETGRYLDTILPPAAAENRAELFARVLKSERPIYFHGAFVFTPGAQRGYAWVLLPVSSVAGHANLIFGMARFGRIERQVPAALAKTAPNKPARIVHATQADLESAARAQAGGAANKLDKPRVTGASFL